MDNQQTQNSASNAIVTSNSQVQNNAEPGTNQLTFGVNQQKGINQQSGNQGTKVVIGVFSDRSSAEKAISELRSQGFDNEEINIVSKGSQQQQWGSTTTYDDDITDGVLTGSTLGGIGGLIIGAGVIAIPGYGPILAAGPIAAALSGAVAGGIAGSLIDWAIPAETSRRYEQRVAQGNILAVIKTDAAKVQQAAQILRSNGAADVESHSVR